jgi:sugar O-acyltransferase (sialic acid O-acetyltransferase NeuD family)
MRQPLIIIGTGGNALDVLDVVTALNRMGHAWDVAGFLDDSRAVGSRYEGHEVLGGLRDAGRHPECLFVNAIGGDKSYRKRPDIVDQARLPAERFATLVHPLAAVSGQATIGRGTCINAGAIVAARVTVGHHVWLGAGCVVAAEATVEAHAVIAPGAVLCGFARVGVAGYVSAGACVRQRVTVGTKALVGLGAVVITDVLPGTTVVGNPAHVLVRVPRQGRPTDTPPPFSKLIGRANPTGGPPPGET